MCFHIKNGHNMILDLVWILVLQGHNGKVVSGRKRSESFFREHENTF